MSILHIVLVTLTLCSADGVTCQTRRISVDGTLEDCRRGGWVEQARLRSVEWEGLAAVKGVCSEQDKRVAW